MTGTETRRFGRIAEVMDIPLLSELQLNSYARFLQADVAQDKREAHGLEGLLSEIFPIVSYDGNMQMEYVNYELGKPRYTPDECRQLRLTYGRPFRIRCRLIRKDVEDIMEDSVYLGELPIMIGGGEFIINGAERVIVNQLHRSPGVDFVVESQEGDRPLHGCRIIPERGSWIEINVTKKDVMVVRIDQSGKMSVTTFLRAMDERFGSTENIIREFYATKKVAVDSLKAEMWAVGAVIDKETGEELVKSGCLIGEALQRIQQSALKTVEVCDKFTDPVILNSLAEDTTEDHEQALMRIYSRLRPGNPVQAEKAKTLFAEKFFDSNRYRLGRVGRFRLNRKFGQQVSETEMTLRPDDFLSALKYVVALRSGQGEVDDIDHLGNRRLRTIQELAMDELRKGFLKLRRAVQERMSVKDPDQLGRISDLMNSKSVTSSIDFFFGRGELSQVVDQTNPLSQLTHERRLSALGPGGLNRKRAGFEVRDVHISHYGRVCPIETPEGTNIGLIASLSIYSTVDDYGFLVTPYRKVENGKASKIEYLRADQEIDAVLAPTDVLMDDGETLVDGAVLARVDGDLAQVESSDVDYVDISSKQTVGISAALIPFLEHDDANRALMGSNMQRQAVPLLITEPPVVATGMEKVVASNSSMVVKAKSAGKVTYVDAARIVINEAEEYHLRKFVGLNERTCLNQKPIVRIGQKVKQGEVIADGAATSNGELALGRNLMVGFMMYDGYNFEDAILISERLVKDDVFTSIHIEEFETEIRETKLGREEFTRDIPNVSEKALGNLDEVGVAQVGTWVKSGDILVGKVSPKSKSELSPEEKLLYAIFGRAGEDVKNDSLELPSGVGGIVIDTKRFSRRMYMSDEQKKEHAEGMKIYGKEMDNKIATTFRQMCAVINEKLEITMVDPGTRQKVGLSDVDEIVMEQVQTFTVDWVKPGANRDKAEEIAEPYLGRLVGLEEEKQRKLTQMKRGDELPSGVLEMVKVYVASKRRLSVGDKMAGRHGNKGVIARILPEEDMPFLEDGTPLDILLNPLGVPSRMNVGQVLETHLGWAAKILGFQAITPVFDGLKEAQLHQVVAEANEKVRTFCRHEQFDEIAANRDKWIEKNYEQWRHDFLGEFSFVATENAGGLLEKADLKVLKSALIAQYKPKLNKGEKTLGSDAKAKVETSPRLKEVLEECKKKIEPGREQDWGDAGLLASVPEKQGVYFIKSRLTGKIQDGYIGLATDLRKGLMLHYNGVFSAARPDDCPDKLVKTLADEVESQLRSVSEDAEALEVGGGDRQVLVEMPYGGKVQLRDGRTGELFEQKVTVGYMYIMKLHHLVDDKIHARATGPYSLITQQPLGGKARTGGQRFGEMEVWGLEAYGASYTLQELLTVKSDDVEGRTKIYESMVKGKNVLEAGTPVSFDVLCNEVRGLGLNIQLEKKRII